MRIACRMGWFGLVLLPGLGASTTAVAAAERTALAFPKPEIKEWTLDNGLDVVYLGVHKIPVVTVQVWYHAGSKDEPRNRRGSAHMFEHIMFKGTKHVPPEEHARLLDRLGGVVHASITEDMTFYRNTVPKQYMDFAMRLEAERMQHLLFGAEMIDTEREVVKEEIRLRFENKPIARAFQRFREMAFIRHPYGWHPGGYIEDLDKTTPEDLEKFYDTYYQPNNAVLIVVGDVTEQEVRRAAQRWFGAVPRAADPPRPSKDYPEPEQTELRKERVEPAQVGVIIGGYKVPAAKHDDRYSLQVLVSILSHGESSRLHQRIVRKDKVGVASGAYLQQFEEPGLMLVFGVFLAADQADKLEAAMLDEVAKLQQTPVVERELDKAKNQLAAQLVFGLQNVAGLAYQIGVSKIMTGEANAWLDDYEKYLSVTPADIQRVAKRYLTPQRLTVVTVPPGGGRAGGSK